MHRWIMDEWKALEHGAALLGEIKSAVPSRAPATSLRNNRGETRAEGWSFLLWQASKQPAGWIAVIGVKCPQLAVHWQSRGARFYLTSPLRKEEGGSGTGMGLCRLTHVVLTLAAVWRMKHRLPYKIDCHIIIGPYAGQKGVMRLQMEKRRHILTLPSNGFLCACVCVCLVWDGYWWERDFLIIGQWCQREIDYESDSLWVWYFYYSVKAKGVGE